MDFISFKSSVTTCDCFPLFAYFLKWSKLFWTSTFFRVATRLCSIAWSILSLSFADWSFLAISLSRRVFYSLVSSSGIGSIGGFVAEFVAFFLSSSSFGRSFSISSSGKWGFLNCSSSLNMTPKYVASKSSTSARLLLLDLEPDASRGFLQYNLKMLYFCKRPFMSFRIGRLGRALSYSNALSLSGFSTRPCSLKKSWNFADS